MSVEEEYEHDQKYGVYWKQDDPIPYCAACFEAKKKSVHLVKNLNTANEDQVMYECKLCKADYYIYREDIRSNNG